jgi:hypothetical protein
LSKRVSFWVASAPCITARRISLISAGEHLRLVWDGLARHNLYSTAQHTAVRSALVGAAQAVWITAPDEPATRRRHGHAVIAESYEQLRKSHQRTLEVVSELRLSPAQEQQVRDQVAWITTREQALAAVQPAPMKLNIADVLRDIGPAVSRTPHCAGAACAWPGTRCPPTHTSSDGAWPPAQTFKQPDLRTVPPACRSASSAGQWQNSLVGTTSP